MRKCLEGCLVLGLAVAVAFQVRAFRTPCDDCRCNYTFGLFVPSPMVGGVGTGSGFVVHSDGYVLTNYHVVEGSRSVQVKVGGRDYTAAIVDSLPAQDLALLKIEARGLAVVALGNSDHLEVGDDVLAIGCPGGVCGTVTAGRIANIGVTIAVEGGKELQGMIMVDIMTDHGSSGGPLVNSRGEVVGVTTAGKQGSFGFSIPINKAIPLLRRVPGFDVRQMGQATTELPFRVIRDRMTPVTALIRADTSVALQLPARYQGWALWGGKQCPDLPFLPCRCLVDEVVAPGFQLRGALRAIADYETWTRNFPGRANGPITYTRQIWVWVVQLESSFDASSAAAACCCPERLSWSGNYGRAIWGECGACLSSAERRTAIFTQRAGLGPSAIFRRVSRTSADCGGWETDAVLTYTAVAVIDAFVVVMVARASLTSGSNDCGAIWADEKGGLLIGWAPLLGTTPPQHVVITYDAFISWATSREKELLEYILAQL